MIGDADGLPPSHAVEFFGLLAGGRRDAGWDRSGMTHHRLAILRRQHFKTLHRLVRNFVLSIPGFAIVRLAMLPIPIAVAMWAQQKHIGLLNWLALPSWAAVIATFLLMDYAYWWWH